MLASLQTLTLQNQMSWASDAYGSVETVSGTEFAESLWIGGLYIVSLIASLLVLRNIDYNANRVNTYAVELLGDRCANWNLG